MSRCGESHYKTQPYQRDNPDEQMRGVGGAMERPRKSSRKRPTSRIHGVSCLPDRYPGVATMVPGVPELVSYVFEAHPAVATMARGVSCLPDKCPGVATMVPGKAELVLYVFEALPAIATMVRREPCLPDKYPGVATMVPGVAELVLYASEAPPAIATMTRREPCLPDKYPGVATMVPGVMPRWYGESRVYLTCIPESPRWCPGCHDLPHRMLMSVAKPNKGKF